jgi:heat shock protein HslJ
MLSPGRVLLALVSAALLAGCAAVIVSGRNIDGTAWRATSVAGMAPVVGREPTLRFEYGWLNGSGGCNGIASQAPIVIRNDRLESLDMLMTLGECLTDGGHAIDPVMPVEELFWSALTAADHIALRGEKLVITGPKGEIILVPDR